jgi:hypothetical protein
MKGEKREGEKIERVICVCVCLHPYVDVKKDKKHCRGERIRS